MTESHDAAATSSAYFDRHRPRKYARVSVGGSVTAAVDLGIGDHALHPATRDQPVVEPLVQPHVAVLQVDEHQLVRVPVEPFAVAIALQQLELRHPVELT